jgi:hypothetical protein
VLVEHDVDSRVALYGPRGLHYGDEWWDTVVLCAG